MELDFNVLIEDKIEEIRNVGIKRSKADAIMEKFEELFDFRTMSL